MPQKASLLFVDDEERVTKLLKMIFRSDYEVWTATSGRAALEIISRQAIDVVVSDQRMPGMTGIELLAEIRKVSPATMRILLTGYSDLAAILGSVNEGEVFRFVNKPWDHDDIKRIVGEAADIARSTSHEVLKASDGDTVMPSGAVGVPELLLLDDNQADLEAMVSSLGAVQPAHCARSIPEALKILETHDVGVIVTESQIGGEDTRQLLSILKRHYPAITTVMMTRLADSDAVIKLINEAQVYRVATKPIRAGAFQTVVTAAMKQHMRYRCRPELVKRHSVAPSSEPESGSLVAVVLKSLSGFRQRLSRLMMPKHG